MTQGRTTVSNWLYRVTLGLIVIGAIRMGKFSYDLWLPTGQTLTGPVYWVTLFSQMTAPFSLFVAALAMALRSGAVVWLLSLQCVLTCALIVPTILAAGITGVSLLAAILIAAVVTIGFFVFRHLIRQQEIRRP